MKREISIDDDPQGSREAVFKSSLAATWGKEEAGGTIPYWNQRFGLCAGGWLRTFITCIRLFGDT